MKENTTCPLKALEWSYLKERTREPIHLANSNNQAEDIDEERERGETKTKTSLLVQNQEIRRERGIWYNIKILMVDVVSSIFMLTICLKCNNNNK